MRGRDNARRPALPLRRSGEIAGPIIPSATLCSVLFEPFAKKLPHSVLCVAARSSSILTRTSGTTLLHRSNPMQNITPFLWFDGKAEEAAKFYTSIFENSKIVSVTQMSATFQLEGLEFIAFNGGPMFTFSPAVSFFVRCETQEEIDCLWEKLSAGGETQKCGWLKDKFGISWQIVPPILGEFLNDEDDEKSNSVMEAMMKMSKLDIKELKEAYEGK
jgi:predicted 3-demethylubiquinone-9 3-methyltransferase (glyoxalase superfamily)